MDSSLLNSVHLLHVLDTEYLKRRKTTHSLFWTSKMNERIMIKKTKEVSLTSRLLRLPFRQILYRNFSQCLVRTNFYAFSSNWVCSRRCALLWRDSRFEDRVLSVLARSWCCSLFFILLFETLRFFFSLDRLISCLYSVHQFRTWLNFPVIPSWRQKESSHSFSLFRIHNDCLSEWDIRRKDVLREIRRWEWVSE